MNATNRFQHDFPLRTTVLSILLYLGFSAWTVQMATSYSGGPRVGVIALGVIFFALALVVLVRRLAFPFSIEMTDDAVLLPRGYYWPRVTKIPYADIISIQDCGDSLELVTGRGRFCVGVIRFEGYRAVREIISDKTAIALEPLPGTGINPKSDGHERPEPLVRWMEPKGWTGFRKRAELSKPFLYQLSTELWFFLRFYTFCFAFMVVPIFVFMLYASLYLRPYSVLKPYQRFAFTISILPFGSVALFATFISMLHWLYGITPVCPETKVSFRDRGISVRLPNGQQFSWNYHQFVGWAVIERHFKEHILQILLLKRLVKGRACNLAFALPDASVREQVQQILVERQLPQMSDIKPSWETE